MGLYNLIFKVFMDFNQDSSCKDKIRDESILRS